MQDVQGTVKDQPVKYQKPPPIFLSYQWDHQNQIKLLKRYLEEEGFECWMDIGTHRLQIIIGMTWKLCDQMMSNFQEVVARVSHARLRVQSVIKIQLYCRLHCLFTQNDLS